MVYDYREAPVVGDRLHATGERAQNRKRIEHRLRSSVGDAGCQQTGGGDVARLHGIAERHAAATAHAVQFHGQGQARSIGRLDRGGAVGTGTRPARGRNSGEALRFREAGGQVLPCPVLAVEHRHRGRTVRAIPEHAEQLRLGVAIPLPVAVELQVLVGDVGDHRGSKRQPVDPAGGESDRGNFDNRGAKNVVGHACQQRVQLRRLRCRQPPRRVDHARPVIHIDARYQSGRNSQPVQEQLREPRRGALAIRAGHSDQKKTGSRIAGMPGAGRRQRLACVGDLQVAHGRVVRRQVALVDHPAGSSAYGAGDEPMAVVVAAGPRHEQIAGIHLSGIVPDRGDGSGRLATDAQRLDASHEPGQIARRPGRGFAHAAHRRHRALRPVRYDRPPAGARIADRCISRPHSYSSTRAGRRLRRIRGERAAAPLAGTRRPVHRGFSAGRRSSRRTPRRW